MKNAIEFKKRCELIDALSAEGVEGIAADLVADATAKARHEWRASQAFLNAMDWIKKTFPDAVESCIDNYALAILAADLIGVGGRQGVEGLSTDRHPALTGCGKGRKQATDGPAWTASIRHAINLQGRFRLSAVDGHLWGILTDHYTGQVQMCPLPIKLFPRPWRMSVTGVGLLCVTGAEIGAGFFAFEGEAKEWAALYTQAVLDAEQCPLRATVSEDGTESFQVPDPSIDSVDAC